MGKIKEKAMEFLENGGYDLEYDEWNMPRLEDLDAVLDEEIVVWEYLGMTEEEYYGVLNWKGDVE
jgi:hypothetical protein